MITAIKNGKVLLENSIAENLNIYINNSRIYKITEKEIPCEKIIDAGGNYISPGFIDIHTHGAGGYDFLDQSEKAYSAIAKKHARHGTTAIVPTLTSVNTAQMKAAIKLFKAARSKQTAGAALLGLHAEGPYLAESQKGAQESRFIRDFDSEEYREILELGRDYILRWSAAPEKHGSKAFAQEVLNYGVLPCIGHSDADYDCVKEAFKNGFTHVTHLYSCTSTVHRKNAYRYAGIVEAAYLIDEMTVEIIADGIHLPPPLLKMVYKFKGADKIALITDSMRAAGMPDGESVLGNLKDGLKVIVEDGVAKLPDRTAFAGSVATCDKLVRNMVTLADVPLTDAVKMAATTPAKILKLKGKGALKEGHDADIVIFDKNINVQQTIVSGNVVFDARQCEGDII